MHGLLTTTKIMSCFALRVGQDTATIGIRGKNAMEFCIKGRKQD